MLTPMTLPCYLTINQSEHHVWADHIPWKLPFLALPLFYLFIFFRFNPKHFYFFYFILFFNFTILYSFSHILTWLHHRYTRVPHPRLAFKNGSQKPIQKFRTFKHQLPGLLAWHLQNTLHFLYHNPVSVDWLYCSQASGFQFGSVTSLLTQRCISQWHQIVLRGSSILLKSKQYSFLPIPNSQFFSPVGCFLKTKKGTGFYSIVSSSLKKKK